MGLGQITLGLGGHYNDFGFLVEYKESCWRFLSVCPMFLQLHLGCWVETPECRESG